MGKFYGPATFESNATNKASVKISRSCSERIEKRQLRAIQQSYTSNEMNRSLFVLLCWVICGLRSSNGKIVIIIARLKSIALYERRACEYTTE